MDNEEIICTKEEKVNMCRGRTAMRDVYDDMGNLVVARGDEITDNVLHHALLEDELDELATAAGVECRVINES